MMRKLIAITQLSVDGEETLGLEFISEDPFALVFSAHGTTLRTRREFGSRRAVRGWPGSRIRTEISCRLPSPDRRDLTLVSIITNLIRRGNRFLYERLK
jgi:hypothetical protein